MGGWGKTGVASGMGVEMKDALRGGVGECRDREKIRKVILEGGG